MNKLEEYEALVDTPEAHAVMGNDKWKTLPSVPVPPRFEPEWLPITLREMVLAVAECMNVPVDLPALVGLAVSSLCTVGRVKVHYTHNWSEPIQLYILCSMESGGGKTPVFKEMTKFLLTRQEEINKQKCHEIKMAMTSLEVLEVRRANAVKQCNESEALALASEIESYDMPRELSHFISGNVTPERLAEIMRDNGGSAAVIDDEGELFDMLSGRFSELPDYGPYLKGCNGDDSVEMQRKSGKIKIPRANLAVLAGTQPYVIKKIYENERMASKGINSRFLLACLEPCKEYAVRTDIPDAIALKYRNVALRMFEYENTDLSLSADAHSLFTEWDKNLNELKYNEWSALKDNGHLSKLIGYTLRIAGNLFLWDGRKGTVIDAALMRSAIEIVRYFAMHKLVLLGTKATLTESAKEALEVLIQRGFDSESKVKDALRKRKRFRAEGAAGCALDELEKAGYIRRTAKTNGGRPSTTIELHPDLRPRKDEARI